MQPADLAPFAQSIGIGAEFYFPEGPIAARPSGRSWWPLIEEARASAIAAGPRDLYDEHPAGARAAREYLSEFVGSIESHRGGRPLVLLGFSQGGMLACDAFLRGDVRADALVVLSSSRISADDWQPLANRLRGLPVLVSHGRTDPDLSFQAGEALRDFCLDAGADVTWVPFDGPHEIPLLVWRRIRKFLGALAGRTGAGASDG